MTKVTKSIAIIFEDVGGYFYCDADSECLAACGTPSKTKGQAMRRAAASGYTHAEGSGTYWDGVQTIPSQFFEF